MSEKPPASHSDSPWGASPFGFPLEAVELEGLELEPFGKPCSGESLCNGE